MCKRGDLDRPVMRRRAHPERERRTGVFCWNDAICSVGDGGRTADWLCRLRPPEGAEPLLILPHPLTGVDLSVLCADAGARRAVVTLDCPEGRSLAADPAICTATFSEGKDQADLTARDLRLRPEGLAFVAVTRGELIRVTVPVEELYPALAALTAACCVGVPLEQAGEALCALWK